MLNKLKDDILRLLKEDEEFRYAVIGLLGLQRLEEAIARLVDIQAKVEDRLSRVEDAISRLTDSFMELKSIVARQEERLEEHDRKFNEIIEELRDLRRISNEHTRILEEHTRTLKEIKAYIDRTSLTLEEEAREVIAYRLKEKGILMSISNLILPDIEVDIYATDTNLCLIGEAKTRVSSKFIEEIDNNIERLCKKYPEYLRDNVIKVVYGMQILPDAVEEARKRGIWLITANREYTQLMIR